MGLLRRRRHPDHDHPRAAEVVPAASADEATEAIEGLAGLSSEMERRLPGVTPAGRLAWYREHGRRRASALVSAVAGLLSRGGLAAAKGAGYGGRALADRLLEAAPRIPIRDLATLRAQHPDAVGPEELAFRLALGACRASAAVGASVGAAAMLPTPPAMPLEIAAETLAVAAVEIKLIAELHEVYGQAPVGTRAQRASAYVTSWADRRGIDRAALIGPAGLAAVAVSAEVRHKVRKRLTRSTLRRLPSLAPMLVGAGAGVVVNRRDTRKLAARIRSDLRGLPAADPGYWEAAAPPVSRVDGSSELLY
ncbi:hypothetical protein [Kitasatospora sp. MAP5-34]|uniref:hypothetical protein n=1 Tax=Kitasatospora sp. MAP5-34 TaxID=3035102 RepID=UPI0024744601|nr:hypothetical protein [Kitasatospora sp. MAP5-34]MDH6574544.1 hypothetical protein [Kitasatospora sp. MAP5-34]